jgi:hypothetical protein
VPYVGRVSEGAGPAGRPARRGRCYTLAVAVAPAGWAALFLWVTQAAYEALPKVDLQSVRTVLPPLLPALLGRGWLEARTMFVSSRLRGERLREASKPAARS